jgi:hypothetical protein
MEQCDVVAEGCAGLLHIGGRLLYRQRQIAECVGHGIGTRIVAANSGPEERHRLRPGRYPHRQPGGHSAPGGIAGSDQHLSAAGWWPVGSELARGCGIVIDQQPLLPLCQLIPHQTELRLLVAELRQAQPDGQLDQPSGNR